MRKSAWFFVLVLGLLLAWLVPLYAPGRGENDFIGYWAASRLLVSGGNPYDAAELLRMQQGARPGLGLQEETVVHIWNPPWLLLTLAPLGALPLDLATRVWIVATVFLAGVIVSGLWKRLMGEAGGGLFPLWLAAGFLYPNLLMLINIGQVSILILAAILGGMWLMEKKRYFWAGAVLLLTTVKPHLAYLLLLSLLIWSARERRWSLWAGMFCAGVVSALAVWLILPGWPAAYWKMVSSLPFGETYTTTLGSFLRAEWGVGGFEWAGALLLPLAWPLAKQLGAGNLLGGFNLALATAIPLAPYGFNFDHVLLLPAILEMLAWVMRGEVPRPLQVGLSLGLLGMYAALFYLMGQVIRYDWFIGPSLGLAALYLLGWRERQRFLQAESS